MKWLTFVLASGLFSINLIMAIQNFPQKKFWCWFELALALVFFIQTHKAYEILLEGE